MVYNQSKIYLKFYLGQQPIFYSKGFKFEADSIVWPCATANTFICHVSFSRELRRRSP